MVKNDIFFVKNILKKHFIQSIILGAHNNTKYFKNVKDVVLLTIKNTHTHTYIFKYFFVIYGKQNSTC